jgi:hypothetical protein
MPIGSENYQQLIGYGTLTDLSTKQFYAVKMDTANDRTVTAITGVTDRPIGILQDDPKGTATLKVAANVAVEGPCKAIAGSGGWTRGQRLGVDSTGKLVAITEAIATNDDAFTIAWAIDTASANDIAWVWVVHPYLSNYQ